MSGPAALSAHPAAYSSAAAAVARRNPKRRASTPELAPASTEPIRAPLDMRATLSVNGALLLVLGLVPGALMALCAQAVVQMLST